MLHTYVAENNKKKVRQLLMSGENPNRRDDVGMTPLHIAAGLDDREMMIILLACVDIDVNSRDNNGKTPLHIAAYRFCVNSVIYILASEGVDIESRDNRGNTPLFYCTDHIDPRIVNLLLFMGANVNAINNNMECPLHHAVYDKNQNIVEILLNNGADPNVRDRLGNTPLNDAIWDCVDNTIVEKLLNKGADPTICDFDNVGPLHGSAWRNNYDITTMLLDFLDPNCRCVDGMTPIFLASQEGHTDIVELLLDAGASPDIQTNDGLCPINVASDDTYILLLYNISLDETIVTDDVCPICLENDRLLFKVNCCNTYLHRECAIDWGRKDCPVCRGLIFCVDR